MKQIQVLLCVKRGLHGSIHSHSVQMYLIKWLVRVYRLEMEIINQKPSLNLFFFNVICLLKLCQTHHDYYKTKQLLKEWKKTKTKHKLLVAASHFGIWSLGNKEKQSPIIKPWIAGKNWIGEFKCHVLWMRRRGMTCWTETFETRVATLWI